METTRTNEAPETRKYVTRVKSRACENFGAVDYTITDTITANPGGGVTVVSVSRGICEGERVNSTSTLVAPLCSLESAEAYRLSHGYTRIA